MKPSYCSNTGGAENVTGQLAGGHVFQFVHQHNLVYNTCWEDPRLDKALNLQPDNTVLVITSAGCNALDYTLAGPRRVIAVDLNPRQNALLELKLAGIRKLSYEQFFAMFGRGRARGGGENLRPHAPRGPFSLGPAVLGPLDQVLRAGKPPVLLSRHLRDIRPADQRLHQPHRRPPGRASPPCWRRPRWRSNAGLTRKSATACWTRSLHSSSTATAPSRCSASLAPHRQVELEYKGGMVQFVHDCLDAVFGRLPLRRITSGACT